MVVQIVKSLPRPYEYVVYLDNFFSSIDLFMALKALGVEAVRTEKQGSEFDENLLKLKAVATKEKNWGTTAVTTVDDHVLCMVWQDNNTVLLMTTAHWPEEAQKIVPRDSRSRHHIPEDSVQLDSENNQILPFHEQWWTTIYTWGESTEMLSKGNNIPSPNIDVDVIDGLCFCFI